MNNIISTVSGKTNLSFLGVQGTVHLLDQGATVPFIARYRKAQTHGMDEDQIREIAKVYKYFSELEERKITVLKTIEEQGKLTNELRLQIENCDDAIVLEDLYLPYKPKRKTKATIAIEQGLLPLADIIRSSFDGNIDEILSSFINGEICTKKEALQGAQYIIAEQITENASVRSYVRREMQENSTVCSKKKKTDHKEAFKFELYEDFNIDITKIKPHQLLALCRGESLGILSINLEANSDSLKRYIEKILDVKEDLLFYEEYMDAIKLALSRYIEPSIEREVRKILKEVSDVHAVSIFSQNLRNLLLQSPIADQVVLGIDPGFASGCKVAVVGKQGEYLEGDVIYPVPPRNLVAEAEAKMLRLINKYQVDIISIGNGTAGRETEIFVSTLIKKNKLNVKYLIVNEAGASVYSASEIAKKEFPDLDATQRGNISIARRIQDPLAELVKIDPKSMGVGLYQHDVDQTLLENELEAVVESCVNEVGVDLNSASFKLISFISGLNERLATEIVNYRNQIKKFTTRAQLLNVKGIGDKTFELAAGFLRIRNGDEPLDNTSIHPESYEKVKNLASSMDMPATDFQKLAFALSKLNENKLRDILKTVDLDRPTFDLIIQNLAKPGRDPREDVPPPILRSDVLSIEDLKEGMELNGTVRNVVDFGAFVDIGLKNDALLHVSKMAPNSRRRINNPLEVVQVGDIIKVKIDKIEIEKQRVGLELVP